MPTVSMTYDFSVWFLKKIKFSNAFLSCIPYSPSKINIFCFKFKQVIYVHFG